MTESFVETQQMLTPLSELLGPYPFPKFSAAVIPAYKGALANQSLSIYGPD